MEQYLTPNQAQAVIKIINQERASSATTLAREEELATAEEDCRTILENAADRGHPGSQVWRAATATLPEDMLILALNYISE